MKHHVPAACNEPFGNEVHRSTFGAGGRIERKQFRGERDNVGHAGKASPSECPRESLGAVAFVAILYVMLLLPRAEQKQQAKGGLSAAVGKLAGDIKNVITSLEFLKP